MPSVINGDSNVNIHIIPTGVDAVKALSASLADLQMLLKKTKATMNEVSKAGGMTGVSLGAPLDKNNHKLKEYQAVMKQVGSTMKANTKSVAQLTAKYNMLNAAMKQTGRVGVASVASIKALETGGVAAFTTLSSRADQFKVKMTLVRNSIVDLTSRLRTAAQHSQWVGRQMMVGLSLPLALFGSQAISAFRTLEEEQTRLRKVFFDTGDSVERQARVFDNVLAPAIDRVSAEMGQSRQITTALAADWAAFGTRGTKELERLVEITSRFAALGDVDLDVATPYVRSIFTQFSDYNIDDLIHKLQQVNAVENDTALNTRDFADAIPEVAASMQELEIPFEVVLAQFAAFAEADIPAPEAAHALKFSLQRIVSPTEKARETMEALGLQVYDDNDELRSMAEILVDLNRLLAGSTDKVKNQALTDIFGNRQINRMQILLRTMGRDTAGLRNAYTTALESASSDVAATSEREWKEHTERAGFTLTQLHNKFKMFMEDLGAELAEPLIAIMEKIQIFMDLFSNLSPMMKKIIVGALAAAAAIGPLVYVYSQLQLAITTVIHGMARLLPHFGSIAKETAEAALSSGTFKGKIIQVGDSFLLAKGSVGQYTENLVAHNIVTAESIELTQAAIIEEGRLASLRSRGAAIEAIEADGGFRDPDTGHFLSRADSEALITAEMGDEAIIAADMGAEAIDVSRDLDVVTESVDEIGDAAVRTRGRTSSLFSGIANFIKSPLKGMRDLIGRFATFVTYGGGLIRISNGFKGMTAWIGRFAGKAGIIGAIITVIVLAVKGLQKHWKTFSAEASKAWKPIKDAARGFWDAIKGVGKALTPILDGFKKFESSATDAKNAGSFWKGLGQAIHFVGEVIGGVIDGMAWVIRFITPAIREAAEGIGGFIAGVAQHISGIIDFLGALFSGDWSEIWRTFQNVVLNVVNAVIGYIEFLVDSVLLGVRYAILAIADLVGGMSDLIGKLPFVDDPLAGVEDNLNGIADSIDRARAATLEFSQIPPPRVGTMGDMGHEWGDEHRESFQNALDDNPPQVHPDPPDPDGETQANEWLSEWLGAVKSSVDEIVNDLKQQALDALDAKFEKDLEVYDRRLEAIDAIEEAESRRYAREEYLQRRREMLRQREISFENYTRNRALAIYEGRIDDARMLDLEEMRAQRDHQREVRDLEENRRRDLIQQARDDERERIQIAKDAAKERQDLLRESFEEQLDIITRYTPRTIGEFQRMLNGISGALWQAGVHDWPGAAATGMNMYARAIQNANEDLRQQAAWSGENASTAWLAAFVAGDVQAGLQAASATSPPDLPSIRGGGGGPGGSGSWGSGSTTATNNPSFHHDGGPIHGIAPRDVPATLQTGEYVVQRKAVKAVGTGFLNQINQAHVQTPVFHAGGPVGMGNPAETITSGGEDFIKLLTNAWFYNTAAIGGLTSGAIAYLFQSMGAEVGGKTYAELMPSFSGSSMKQFADWLVGLPQFQALSYSGIGAPRPRNPGSDHPRGFAIDLSRGWGDRFDPLLEEVAQFLLAGGKTGALPTKYVIYYDRFGADYTGWNLEPPVRSYDRHLDHVHLSVVDNIADWANRGVGIVNTPSGGGAPAPGYDGHSSDIRQQAREALAQKGFAPNSYGALNNLITHESNWNPHAQNPRSSAYGLYQFLDQTWGLTGYQKTSDPWIQHLAGLTYIRKIYDNPGNAWNYWQSHGSYHSGGMVPMMAGGKVPFNNYPALLHKGEIVMPRPLSENITRMADNPDTIGGTTVNIYSDTFVGDFEHFKKNMEKYNVQVAPRNSRVAGTSVRRISSRGRTS